MLRILSFQRINYPYITSINTNKLRILPQIITRNNLIKINGTIVYNTNHNQRRYVTKNIQYASYHTSRCFSTATTSAASSISSTTSTPPITSFSATLSQNSVLSHYKHAIDTQGLKYDKVQEEAVRALDAVYRRVSKYASQRYLNRAQSIIPSPPPTSSTSVSPPTSSPPPTSPTESTSNKYKLTLPPPPADVQAIGNVPRGLYIYGTVGIGKTFLMDLLYDTVQKTNITITKTITTTATDTVTTLPTSSSHTIPVRRVHFHSFMLEVHNRIHLWKQQQIKHEGRNRHIDLRPERDAIVQVAKAIASEAWLLCFDEFQITDVADAMIVQRLFSTLFHDGVIVVATSNRLPDDLYLNGLNREYFLPFISTLTTHCRVYNMDSTTDYRRLTLPTNNNTNLHQFTPYMYPLNEQTLTNLHQHLQHIINNYNQKLSISSTKSITSTSSHPTISLATLPYKEISLLMNRTLRIRSPVPGIGIANFYELCSKPLGSSDYIGICTNFHTLYLLDVPRMIRLRHNDARRFITLIDICYEYRINLNITAVTSIDQLFQPLLLAQLEQDKVNQQNIPKPLAGDEVVLEANAAYGETDSSVVGNSIIRSDPAGDSETVQVSLTNEEIEDHQNQTILSDIASVSTNNIPPPVVSIVTSAAEKASFSELTFAIHRAISRLIEMTSTDYTTNIGTQKVKHRLQK